jgi:hypothetical protein
MSTYSGSIPIPCVSYPLRYGIAAEAHVKLRGCSTRGESHCGLKCLPHWSDAVGADHLVRQRESE